MYIEIKMIKEIMDHEESIFFGLSLRQCICSLLALGTSVAMYFLAGGSGWLCVLGAAPFALLGFFKYHSMHFEQFLWVWIQSELLYPKRLVFKAENYLLEAVKEDGNID